LIADYSQPTKYGFIHSDSISIYKLKINKYDKFLNDNDLMKTLQLALFNRGKIIDEETETMMAIDSVIYGIEEELKKLKTNLGRL
jgi:hypothetical protein